MSEVVWVFGASGSGKETFITRALSDTALLNGLGFSSNPVMQSEESIRRIAQTDNDGTDEAREAILEEVPRLLEVAQLVLIKWQGLDSLAYRPHRLRSIVPSAAHTAMCLLAPPSEMTERLLTKPWWHNNGQEDAFVSSERVAVAEYLAQLPSEFQITYVNSGAGGNYAQMEPAMF